MFFFLIKNHYISTKTYVVSTQKNHLNESGSFEHPKHMLKHGYEIILRWKFLFRKLGKISAYFHNNRYHNYTESTSL